MVEVDNRILIEYNPGLISPAQPPVVAREPAAPGQIASIEELYLTGVHLDQYRHATRHPEDYWHEALRRDPSDSRSNNALGLWRLWRGELEPAAKHFETAISRITALNPNPRDGEPFYNLGVTRRYQNRDKEAYDAFYKATWNAAWRGPAYFALAEMDAKNQRWEAALDHVRRSLRADADNLNARNLLCSILAKTGDRCGADTVCRETLAVDPMDIGARWRQRIAPANGQQRLDLAFDFLRAGFAEEAGEVLRTADLEANDGSVPLILFALYSIQNKTGSPDAGLTLSRAKNTSLDYCFPSRLEELLLLESMVDLHPDEGALYYLLGNLLYSVRRHEDAIARWEKASRLLPNLATVWRNLAIAYFNHRGQKDAALHAFDFAFQANPSDGRIMYERDHLWKRVGETPQRRLAELLRYPSLISQRDDLSVEVATLNNQVGQPSVALDLLLHRRFHPWEGGEGLVMAQYIRARLLLGWLALDQGDAATARTEFHAALQVPENLGESKHLLANQNDIYYWLGVAREKLGEKDDAYLWWNRATRQTGDFQQMSVRNISDMTYWSAMAHQRLGEAAEAASIFRNIYEYSIHLEATEPAIDFFATSLPAMLLFNEDLPRRNIVQARFLRAQALTGLRRAGEAELLLREILEMDINHTGAADLLHHIQVSNERTAAGDI